MITYNVLTHTYTHSYTYAYALHEFAQFLDN